MTRLCVAEMANSVIWDHDARSFMKTHTPVYKTFQMYFQNIIGRETNWTMLTTLRDTTCLEEIQANNTDIVVATVHFPLNPNLTNVRQTQVGGEYNMAINSFYDTNVGSGEKVDIIESLVKSFPIEIWGLIIVLLSITGVLMVVTNVLKPSLAKRHTFACKAEMMRHRKKLKKKMMFEIRQTFDMLLKGLLNKDGSLSDPQSRKHQPWSRVSFCFFMFWTTFFFISMIKTELVTVRNPEMINNYADILSKADIMPMFVGAGIDHLTFAKASKDTDAGKIWTRVANQAGGYQESLVDGKRYINGVLKMFSKQKVMISGRERGYAVRSLNCKLKSIYERFLLKKEFRSLKSWISGDASAIPVLRGFVSSVHFDDRNVKKRLCSAFEHAFEKHMHKVVELDIY